MGRSKNSPRAAKALENERKALALRVAGYTYARIGDALGMTDRGAAAAVARGMKKASDLTQQEAETYRQMEMNRLDELQSAVWNDAKRGHLGAVDRALRIVQERCKLLGLHAPKRHHVTGGMLPDDVLRGMSDDDLERLAKGEPLTDE